MSEPVVFIVEDDEQVRGLVQKLVENAGLGVESYPSAEEFLRAFVHDRAACLVVDLCMPGMSGIELHEALIERGEDIPVVIITGQGAVKSAVRSMKAGALDFIEKPFKSTELLAAVKRAVDIDRHQRADRASLASIEARIARLTARERQVLELLVDGMGNKQVAYHFNISIKTVEKHRASLMRKLQAETAVDLARIYLTATQRHGQKP